MVPCPTEVLPSEPLSMQVLAPISTSSPISSVPSWGIFLWRLPVPYVAEAVRAEDRPRVDDDPFPYARPGVNRDVGVDNGARPHLYIRPDEAERVDHGVFFHDRAALYASVRKDRGLWRDDRAGGHTGVRADASRHVGPLLEKGGGFRVSNSGVLDEDRVFPAKRAGSVPFPATMAVASDASRNFSKLLFSRKAMSPSCASLIAAMPRNVGFAVSGEDTSYLRRYLAKLNHLLAGPGTIEAPGTAKQASARKASAQPGPASFLLAHSL